MTKDTISLWPKYSVSTCVLLVIYRDYKLFKTLSHIGVLHPVSTAFILCFYMYKLSSGYFKINMNCC